MRATVLLAVLLCFPSAGARGELSGIAADEALRPGTVRQITWRLASRTGPPGTELELVLSLDGGETFPLRVSPEAGETRREALFRVPNLPTPRARLGLRVGRDGAQERLCALGESFVILADPLAPLEPLRQLRGEAATFEAAPREACDRGPAAGITGVPESLSARDGATDLGEGPPALAPPGVSSVDDVPGEREGAAAPSPAPRPRTHPFRPRRE